MTFTSAFSASILGVSALVPRLENNYLLQRTVQCGGKHLGRQCNWTFLTIPVNAPAGQQVCPLNRCCSQWGFVEFPKLDVD